MVQARIVRSFRWIDELGFELGNPTLRRLKPSLCRFQALPQRHNQRILVRLIELTEVWELGHPQLESSRS